MLQHSSQLVEFIVEVPLPGIWYIWDFGHGEELNTTSQKVQHMYLPGTYTVMVRALAAGKSLLYRATVHVVLPLKTVNLKCPNVVIKELKNINVFVHVQGGTDLSAIWRIKDPRGQDVLGKICEIMWWHN